MCMQIYKVIVAVCIPEGSQGNCQKVLNTFSNAACFEETLTHPLTREGEVICTVVANTGLVLFSEDNGSTC